MKKIILLTVCIFLHAEIYSQAVGSGMQQSTNLFTFFSHLNRGAGIFGALSSEKAIGVYHANVLPVSFLEVNTNPTMFTTPKLPSVANMGEVFSTNSPVDGFWRLSVSNTQIGRIFSNTNNFKVDAMPGDLIFQTGSTDRVWVKSGTGRMGINTNGPTRLLDINGDLRIRNVTNNNTLNEILAIDALGNVFWRDASTLISSLCPNIKCNTTCSGPQPATNVFEVNNDINLSTPVHNHGYRIGCDVVLQDPGTNNIFVGVQAGFTNSTGNSNTFVGHVAGYSNVNAVRGTFVGDSAGYSNNFGRWNTFTGYSCGIKNTTGEANSFYGKHCALNHVNGNQNCFYGNHAAASMIDGNANVMMGSNTAFFQQHGDSNSYVGNMSGPSVGLANVKGNSFLGANSGYYNTVGDFNTYLGYNSGNPNAVFVNNSTVVGAHAIVRNSNHMILGDNNINVGIGLSNDVSGPQKKLEINDNTVSGPNVLNSTTTPPSYGASGLRFRNLTTATTTIPNPGLGVLSVTTNGDVVYVDASSLFMLGGACPSSNNLTSPWEIPLNNNNFYFTDALSNTGSLYIGTNPSCGSITSRLDVINNSKQLGGLFSTNLSFATGVAGLRADAVNTGAGTATGSFSSGKSSGANAIGAQGVSLGGATAANTFAIGVNARSVNASPAIPSNVVIGVNSNAASGISQSFAANLDVLNSSSPQNYGVQVDMNGGTNASALNIGTELLINNTGAQNFGTFISVSGASANNYGVYSSVPTATTTGAGPDYAGFFVGDVVSTTNFFPSDRNLKKDIKQIESSVDILKKLNPVTYNFDSDNHKGMALPTVKQYGFISQEIKEVLPELTEKLVYPAQYDSEGKEIKAKEEYLGMNYNGLIAIMAGAIKEQQQQIEELKALVIAQNGSSAPADNKLSIELSDKNIVVLNQNVPNPFAETTVITYNIPDNFSAAQLLFYDNSGKLIKAIDIRAKGKGVLNVFANDLTSGIYSYTLVIDGKIIDTKKMMKQD
jgi:hypothetical protein